MTNKPWLTEEFHKWNAKVIPMPKDPTLLEMWKPGLTPARVLANRAALFAKMQAEIDAGRERRGECLICGERMCPGGHN